MIITLQGAALVARREGVSADLAEKLDTATTLAKDGWVRHEKRSDRCATDPRRAPHR